MDELAKALLSLDWSDMDCFAEHIFSVTVDPGAHEDGTPDPRSIAQALIEFAHDNNPT